MPNQNPKTGIAYGVIDARKAMDLYDEIQREGVNTTLKDAEDDIKARMTGELGDFEASALFVEHGLDKDLSEAEVADQDQQRDDKEEVLADWMSGCVARATELRGTDAMMVANELMDLVDIDSGTFSIPEVVDQLMTCLQEDDYFCSDGEDCYDYESGGFSYHLSCLGGAPMIWVYQGPYATYGRTCSPCVPGALDCANFTDEDHGNCVGYCVDPVDIDDDADKPEVLYRIDAEGNMTKVEGYQKPEPEEEDE